MVMLGGDGGWLIMETMKFYLFPQTMSPNKPLNSECEKE